MLARVYRSTSSRRPTWRAIFSVGTDWGPQRGGHSHEHWALVEQVDLARPSRPLPFSADDALAALQSEGIFTYQVAASELQATQHQLLNDYRLRYTLPIFDETSKGFDILGTGTLFEHEGRSFIITADHLFRTDPDRADSPLIDMSLIHMPSEPRRPGEGLASMVLLGRHKLHHFVAEPNVDVVVMELLEPETIAILQKHWSFLPFSQAEDVAETDDRFVITGFMSHEAQYSAERNTVTQRMLNLETDLLYDIPKLNTLVPDYDLFLHFQTDGTTVDGAQRRVATLEGLSGGPIWAVRDVSETALWAPAKAMKIVAIQSGEARHAKNWARGFRWSAVLKILRRPELGFAIAP